MERGVPLHVKDLPPRPYCVIAPNVIDAINRHFFHAICFPHLISAVDLMRMLREENPRVGLPGNVKLEAVKELYEQYGWNVSIKPPHDKSPHIYVHFEPRPL